MQIAFCHENVLPVRGGAEMYADYWQWEQSQLAKASPVKTSPKSAVTSQSSGPASKKRLGYLEAREWEQMEARILEAEQELEAIRAEMHSPDVVSDNVRLHACYERLQAAEARVEALYARWAELEAKQAG